ncbi:MAG: I78 family peptidase inhibitor [Luteimonas sp.]
MTAIAETPPATMGCDPAPVQSLLGQEVATPALQSRARADGGAESLRVLAPGQAASREYRAGRLNLQLDAGAHLIRAYCD